MYLHVGSTLDVLTGGLEPEEVEVAQQIVVQREELEVEFGQRQAALARKELHRHDILVPDDGLGGVERHLVERLQLRRSSLVLRDLKRGVTSCFERAL